MLEGKITGAGTSKHGSYTRGQSKRRRSGKILELGAIKLGPCTRNRKTAIALKMWMAVKTSS